MIDDATIKKLAHLSRVSISPEETETLKGDFEEIISYIERIQEVSDTAPESVPFLKNVMRDDGESHETGLHTEALMHEAPSQKDGYIEVRKIIDQE